jgi:hypothetical protein
MEFLCFDRFDESYSHNRRVALQDYFRTILKIFAFKENAEVYMEFLVIPPEALSNKPDYEYNQALREEVYRKLEESEGQIVENSQYNNGKIGIEGYRDEIDIESDSDDDG